MGWKWTQLLWLCTRITNYWQCYMTFCRLRAGVLYLIFGRKWHIALFSFSALYFTTSAYFYGFVLLVSVRFHYVVPSKSHSNQTFKTNSIPISRKLILMDILLCSTNVMVCALFTRYVVEKYIYPKINVLNGLQNLVEIFSAIITTQLKYILNPQILHCVWNAFRLLAIIIVTQIVTSSWETH